MQTYPCGGHKEHYHKVVEEDYEFKDDYQCYNKGSSMQKKPDQCNPQPKHNYNSYGGHDQKKYEYSEEDYQYYNKGSNKQVKPGHSNPPAKDNYKGYGGYDQKKYEYSETCYEENDYSGHGGKHQNAKESQSVGVTLGVGLLKGLLTPLETTASVTVSKESSQCKTGK